MSRPGRGWFRGGHKRFFSKPGKAVGQFQQILRESPRTRRDGIITGVITRLYGPLVGLRSGLEEATGSGNDVKGSHKLKSPRNGVSTHARLYARALEFRWWRIRTCKSRARSVQPAVHVLPTEPGHLSSSTMSQNLRFRTHEFREVRDRGHPESRAGPFNRAAFRFIGPGPYRCGLDELLRTFWRGSRSEVFLRS